MSTLLKCKICGGDISVNADMTVGTCQYCGTTITLPRIDSDKKARLFNRANEYRLNCEYDKAYDAYKTITEEDEQEAEAYWGMILSEYGIEYVEDPNSHKRIPTCHRTHVQSIQDSTNYKLALKYSDAECRLMYRDEAEKLDKLQRQILAISSKEAAYDVFICYKESDENVQRTNDSVLAQSIYNELEKEGVKTFFSRISLESHIGENYEPYIYGALSSARVMLVVATSGDHLESVWVKNEWKRYLSFLGDDVNKTVIPVYQGMSPYELPPELSKFQAQDMEKIGSMQDLIRGINKILGKARSDTNDIVLNELVADKRNGTVYMTQYANLYKADTASLMDGKRYSSKFLKPHYDYVSDQYYITYQSIVFDINFLDSNTFEIKAEDKSKLELIHGNTIYQICEGVYIRK